MAISFQPVAQKIAVATSAASVVPTKTGSGRYLLTTNTDVYIKFGGTTASVTVFDLFLPAGAAIIVQPPSGLISAIRDSADGVLGITEVE